MNTTTGNGTSIGCLNRAAWLSLAILTLTMPAKAVVNGTFKVTENWSVTLTYKGFGPNNYSGVKHFSGQKTGTIVVANGHYLLKNATGMHLSGGTSDLMDRSIYEDRGSYSISGGFVFGPAYGRKAYGLVFAGAFMVKVPLIDGEVPVFWRWHDYEGHGSSLASISGGGDMIGEKLVADVSSTLSLQPSAGGGGGPEITISVEVDGEGTVSPNLDGAPLKAGKTYTLTAKPKQGYIFSGWSGTISNNTPKLAFVPQEGMNLQANFVPNPFMPFKGTYNGMVAETNGVQQRSAGFFTLTLTEKGAYSGSLLLGGTRSSLSGQFDGSGNSTATVKAGGSTGLTLRLHLNLASPDDRITGILNGGTWTALLEGDRGVFDGKTNVPSMLGKYTLIVPGTNGAATLPGGDSFGTVTVDKAGKIRFAGSLADGTKVTQAAIVSRSGEWPLYLPIDKGQGLMQSWITFSSTAAADLAGQGVWIKPATTKTLYYRAGFAMNVAITGCRYVEPAKGTNVLGFSAAQAVFSGGNLAQNITQPFTLDVNDRVADPQGKEFNLSFTQPSGLFKGKIATPAGNKPISFQGVVLQKRGLASGYFLGSDQSGRVSLSRRP